MLSAVFAQVVDRSGYKSSHGRPTQAKKNLVRAIATVALRLGNTPAICRKCYVHPAVLDGYLDGSLLQTLVQQTVQE